MYTLTDPTTVASALALIFGAAVLHATLQLSASVMTLMSGHTLGRKRSHARLLRLCLGYVLGNFVVVALLLFTAIYILSAIVSLPNEFLWVGLIVLGVVTGLMVLLFYYPKHKAGRLWIPTGAADYLYERSKRTTRSFEAFGLGMTTAIAELPFIAAPLLLAAMILQGNPDASRLMLGFCYVLIACLPLFILIILIGGGKKISRLEQWRSTNHRFLQAVNGVGIIVISLYAYVSFGINQARQ